MAAILTNAVVSHNSVLFRLVSGSTLCLAILYFCNFYDGNVNLVSACWPAKVESGDQTS